MPKEIMHFYLAHRTYQMIPESTWMREVISRHYHLFIMGAVVLDSPFYGLLGRYTSFLKSKATHIHNSVKDSSIPLNRLILNHTAAPAESRLALAAGAYTHIIADAVCHPMVYWYCGLKHPTDKLLPTILHQALETVMDLHVIKHVKHRRVSRILQRLEISPKAFFNMAGVLFDVQNPIKITTLKKMFWQHQLLQYLFLSPGLHRLLQLLRQYTRIDCRQYIALSYPVLNSIDLPFFKQPLTYRHPVTNTIFSQTLDMICDDALELILKGFSAMEAQGKKALQNDCLQIPSTPNLITGLLGVTTNKMRFFDKQKTLIRDLFKDSMLRERYE